MCDDRITPGDGRPRGAVASGPPVVPGYELSKELGRGGTGVVYRATDLALGREVAIKILQPHFAHDSDTARRFTHEARITAQLQHPGIPPAHALGTLPDGRPFLAIKRINGHTLDDLLKDRPDPSVDRPRFLAVFEQVCQAVAYAHDGGVIHRDMKPANVMVGSYGVVQVMDWGLAKRLTPAGRQPRQPREEETAEPGVPLGSDPLAPLTVAGSVLGTPAYMPPEQAGGTPEKVDARGDVFGLGAILATILTGHPPFRAESAEVILAKAARGDVKECLARLTTCGAEPDLVALCRRCLSPTPADRPGDAGEVAHAVAVMRRTADERARQADLDRARAEERALLADELRRRAEATTAAQRKRWKIAVLVTAALLATPVGLATTDIWR